MSPVPSPRGDPVCDSSSVDLQVSTREESGRTVVAAAGEVDVYTAPVLDEEDDMGLAPPPLLLLVLGVSGARMPPVGGAMVSCVNTCCFWSVDEDSAKFL